MTILGIETSCDETGAALVRKNPDNSLIVLANSVASSLSLHAQTGGIIPEVAAREQVKFMLPVLQNALKEGLDFDFTGKQKPAIDAIAVTYGPGLIGSLLVGVETAKTLSLLWDIPLIPVNHLFGHIYANWLTTNDQRPTTITFPALALVVSGGHTDLVLMQDHNNVHVIGGTRDDAAGEAFDKIGRLLGMPYPAGPTISRLAEKGDPKAFALPRPMIGSHDFDFSFSGHKTAVLNLVKQNGWQFEEQAFREQHEELLSDLCASVQQAIVDVLVRKTIKAAQANDVKTILLGGGVSANDKLRDQMNAAAHQLLPGVNVVSPKKSLSTDNAAMIAAAATFTDKRASNQDLTANPQLYYV
jgi:N6-L-threonylcarbamoyladenine synthase